tara:strand:+ start:1852 stop:2757 length:906 start_codon:yes stop_codon:yes gene_type:complete
VTKLPVGVDINNLIDDLRFFSWEAAEILLYYSKELRNSNNKNKIIKNEDENDPVTLADLKVDELITKRIMEKYSGIDWEILSEENIKMPSNNVNTDSEFLWILDPLDGTKDFIEGTGNYAMHLALNHKQVPFLGIVLIPERNQLWITNGNKTWCEDRDGSNLETEISKNIKLNEMTIVTSKNHRNEILEDLIKKLNFRKRIIMGSVGCKIASIIRGESDIYISISLPERSSPKDWDFAAPEAILKAVGGAITTIDNQNLLYNGENYEQRGIIIASNNKDMHGEICSEIQGIIKKYNLYPFN